MRTINTPRGRVTPSGTVTPGATATPNGTVTSNGTVTPNGRVAPSRGVRTGPPGATGATNAPGATDSTDVGNLPSLVDSVVDELHAMIGSLRCAGTGRMVKAGISMTHLHILWVL